MGSGSKHHKGGAVLAPAGPGAATGSEPAATPTGSPPPAGAPAPNPAPRKIIRVVQHSDGTWSVEEVG